MTFEQGGLGRAGTTVVTNTGDTLTLADRIAHHYTTSMSTVEVAAKNNSRIINAFKQFFDNANNNGIGEYKTFVVADGASSRAAALKKLLDANGITYTYSSGLTLRGLNYFTQKEESFVTKNSLLISTYQPKGVLAKVLFEPKSKLADSATYDITAWALPYAYNLQAFAVKERLQSGSASISQQQSLPTASAYGYLASYTSFEDAKFLAALCKLGVKLRFAETDFSYGGKKFNRGSLIILQKGNEAKMPAVFKLAAAYGTTLAAVQSGFMDSGFDFGSSKAHFIAAPRVALVTGKGASSNSAGEIWHLFDKELQYPITLINADDLGNVNWKNIDVLIVPDGRYRFLTDKDAGGDLKNWVRQGGKLVALEGAVAQMASGDWGIKLKKEDEKKDDDKNSYENLRIFAKSEHDGIRSYIAGAIYRIDLDITHPLAFGLGERYFTLKQDDNVYEFLKDGWNVGVIKKDNYVAGFVGSAIKDKIKDGLMIGEQQYEGGTLVYLPDNPVFRCFWESGKQLLANAVFFAGQ
jgi:hypothetical protein